MHLLLALAITVSSMAFFSDLQNVRQFASVDLRWEMAAARHLINGFDPYFIKVKTDDGREFLRPTGEGGTPLFFVRCYPIAKLRTG